MAWMQSYSGPSGGTKTCLYTKTQQILNGDICPSTEDLEYAWEVSLKLFRPLGLLLTQFSIAVDFALVEAGYTVVRLIQSFKTIKLPENEIVELVGVEKQVTTFVVSIKDGCKVEMR
jgi:hypothetical protein